MENTKAFPQTRPYRSKKRIPATIVTCVCASMVVLFLVLTIVYSVKISDLRSELSGLEQGETQSYFEGFRINSKTSRLEFEISSQISQRRFFIVAIVFFSVVGAFVGGLLFYLARETERRVEARRKDEANKPYFQYYD